MLRPAVVLLLVSACHRPTEGDTALVLDTVSDSSGADSGADTETAAETAPDTEGDSETGCDQPTDWYTDEDGDGYGVGEPVSSCDQPPGTAAQAGDCDDTRPSVSPGAPELYTSGRDDDCDGIWGVADHTDVPYASYESSARDGFAIDVDSPGDLDGDSLPDLVVMSKDGNGATGEALVYHGPRSRTGAEFDPPVESTLVGGPADELNWFSSAGDVDGDGYTDVLVSGVQGSTADQFGVTYLMRGPIAPGVTYLTEAALALRGLTPYDNLCLTTGPFDANDDGLTDVIAAAPETSGRDEGYGHVYILHGPVPQTSVADADTILAGNREDERVGLELGLVGDADGDGRPDLGVSTYTSDYHTAVYLLTSEPDGVYHPSELGITLDVTGLNLGITFNRVGDVNEDGYDDVAIGAIDTSTIPILLGPLSDTAVIDVWRAAEINLVSYNSGVSETDLSYTTALGDWDGDGHDDLVAANALYAPPETRGDCSMYECLAGALFLVAGPLHPGTIDLEVSADRVDSNSFNFTFGQHLAAGEDLDQDGFPDLAVSHNQVNSAYLFFGGGLI